MRQTDEVEQLAARWREQLADWAIPPGIRRRVREDPWALPPRIFSRRAEQQLAAPTGPSFERAVEALAEPGEVLDVGAGAGAASLPLAGRSTRLTAVDVSGELLVELRRRARSAGRRPATAAEPWLGTVQGRWPDVAAEVGTADLVVCHHVLYNVPDLPAFVTALTGHARRRVVCELTERHPLSRLNPLWRRFHGLDRPRGPTADDALALLHALGLRPRAVRWTRPAETGGEANRDRVELTRLRLCLPPERAGEVAGALAELDTAGPVEQSLVTVWWPGGAPPGR
ncbi:MAG TPA: methyltransferase domain-containing protein [Actinomycetes bacterium]|nr:methyltransferase domain-containing protein [Actinomycetes bacterium]